MQVHFDCLYRGITAVSSRESKLLAGNRSIAQVLNSIVCFVGVFCVFISCTASFWMNYQRIIPCFVLAIRVQSWSCSRERTKAWVCGQCQWSIFCTSCTKTPSSNVLGNWGDESRGKGDGILLLCLNTTYVVLIPCSFIVSLPSFLTF